jgi:type II secretory pathway pseudopilin PulG
LGEISKAQKVEQDAQLALNVAQAALDAAQKKDASDPALGNAIAAAVSAIPSPWTPVLASLIPAAIPLVVSIVQSVRLGRAHQTVQTVTQQLQEHQAALAAISSSNPKS